MDDSHLTDSKNVRSGGEQISPLVEPAQARSLSTRNENLSLRIVATGSLEGVSQSIESLLTTMNDLRQDFDTKVKYDESKERLISSLHKELQIYRDGLHFHVLRPIFLDLITMHDDLSAFIENMYSEELTVPKHIAHGIETFLEVIEEILHRNGVEAFSVELETFLPSRQRNMRVITTDNRLKDKHIARRVRKGFEYEGKLLRPEIVETYKY
jgi:molecular chaperone GrpE